MPILALAPLSLAAKGCTNSGVVGDDCPTAADCMNGTAGSSSTAGTGNMGDKVCGGLLGTQCGKGDFCSFAAEAKCGAGDMTGTCQRLPEACDASYRPVCGCDGKTYGNGCGANSAGVSVASEGECGAPDPGDGTCGGLLGTPCGKSEFCNFAPETKCGSGDQTGVCAPTGGGCTKELNPVCGCDGVTYGNACMAQAAGISVASKGECAPDPSGTCGGKTGVMCAADQYCNYPPAADCGRFDAPGKCVDIVKGGACDAAYVPVCGCDGMTYGNECTAVVAGVSIDYEGACGVDPGGQVCGGITGTQCEDPARYCDYPLETKCGAGDMQGDCKLKPEVCTQAGPPVCGCDGLMHVNACQANAKGVSVAFAGLCPK